jgi:hypothetical protein
MFRRFWLACVLLSVSTLLAYGQDDSKVEIFGGYQYLHASTGVSGVSQLQPERVECLDERLFYAQFRCDR